MPPEIWRYQGEGTAPEGLVVDLRNERLRLTVRGEPTIVIIDDPVTGWREEATPGQTAVMTMPLARAIELGKALLSVPPIAAMAGGVPFVLFFDTTMERDRFVERLRSEDPGVIDLSSEV